MKNPVEVYVLQDGTGTVFGVTTNESVADEWQTFDSTYTAFGPIDLNDLTLFDEARDAVLESEDD